MSEVGSVGIIGVGQLGLCFVDRLCAAGLNVYAYDVDPTALANAHDAGAHTSRSPADVAKECLIILICVTGPEQVRECSLGLDGLRSGLREGTIVIDTSTSLPATTRDIASSLAGLDVKFFDAPVSRGVPAARAGTLSIMVGVDSPDVIERARPVLTLLGTDITVVGGVGAGHAVKLMNMLLMGAHLVASAEALGLGAAAGIDVRTMSVTIDSSAGRSYMTTNHLPRFALASNYDSGFNLNLMIKDLRLGRSLADSLGVVMPLSDRVWHAYKSALGVLGNVDNMRLVPYLAALAAGKNLQQAREAALSGLLPDKAPGGPTIAPTEIAAMVASSNSVAFVEATRLAGAARLSPHNVFSVIDMSSGGSQFTAQFVTNKSSARDFRDRPAPTSAFQDTWVTALAWAERLGSIAPRWSCSNAAEAEEHLLGIAAS